MGSNETATAIPGALEKLTFFTGTGRHRVQIIYFFRMKIGSRTLSGIGLGSGGRLRRMRRYLGLSRELWIQNFGDLYWRAAHCSAPVLICIIAGSTGACGVGDYPSLEPILGSPWETSGPRIDRIPPARPSWRDRRYRESRN